MHFAELGENLGLQAMGLGDDLSPFAGAQEVAAVYRPEVFILQKVAEPFHLLDRFGGDIHIGLAVVHSMIYNFPVAGQVKSSSIGFHS
jgi:hypothetical protein